MATSAVRDATNQAEFLARVARESGLKLRVLSTEEEAYYGYLGAVNALNLSDAFLIDIGGGSAEVTAIRGRGFMRSFSRPAGVLRFSERYVRSDPISSARFQGAAKKRPPKLRRRRMAARYQRHQPGRHRRHHSYIGRDRPEDAAATRLIGSTATASAATRLDEIIDMLRGMTLAPARGCAGTQPRPRRPDPGRRGDLAAADAIGPLHELPSAARACARGLFYEQFLVGENPPLFSDMRGFSVQNLARIYNYEAIHSAKVRELSLSLFDQLRPLHGYGEWERELLGYAAILHDIGVAVGYYDHHKHGAYLVINSALQGFSHREIVMLALLVRYHRKGDVSVETYQRDTSPQRYRTRRAPGRAAADGRISRAQQKPGCTGIAS